MKILSVGSLYPSKTKLIDRVIEIRLSSEEYEFATCVTKPTQGEIDVVQRGKGRFWLIFVEGLIIIQFRFSNENGSRIEGEVPFHIGLYDKSKVKCSIEDTEADKSYFFSFALVEQGSNMIKALRSFTLGPKFLAEFRTLIERQRTENPDPTNYLNDYYRIASVNSLGALRGKSVCYANIGSDINKGDL